MKLLVFDVDGTLVGTDYVLPQTTIDSLNFCLKRGDAIAIASGRPYLGIKQYLDMLVPGKKFCIAANGGATYDYDGNVLGMEPLRYQDFLDFYNKFKKYEFDPKIQASIYCYTLHEVGYFELSENTKTESICNGNIKLRDFNKEPCKCNEPILKIMFAGHQKDIMNIDFSAEKKKYHFVDSSEYYHEYVNPLVDKASGVETLRILLHLTKDECYCFGDEMNDYLMIKNYNGVAMGNCRPIIATVAKYKTLSVDKDGVSYAIKNYVK